ncbi:MAG TPA: GntR family transcriptional regulator [Terriglobales bacterium]|nr:GntR family transcriptional regulator [Terriglobales bacterium]
MSLPAYQRILGTIRQRIEQGELRCGDLVESERELARRHEVSLMTARHALTELQREGLVERRRGAGTFVAAPKIQFNKLTSFTEQMAGRSLLPQSRLLSTKVIEDEQEIAARLALPPGSPLLVIERMRQAAGEPFALETCYFSAKDFSWLTSASLERTSLFALLERDYGAELSYSDESIDATVADGKLAKLLQIARGAPLLRICQVIFSSRGTAITYVRGIYRSDRHTVRIRRTR